MKVEPIKQSEVLRTTTTIERPKYLENALAQARLGIPIAFVPAGQKGMKGAACVGWEEIATTDRDEIIRRATASPHMTNYACVARAVVGGNLFLDDDGGIRSAFEATGKKMAETLKGQSCSGNFHYTYKHSAASLAFWERIGKKAYISEKNPDGPGELWSLRMDRAYIVGPGSVAENHEGKMAEYKTVWPAAIIEIPDDLLQFLIKRYESDGTEAITVFKPADANAGAAPAKAAPGGWKKPTKKEGWIKELNSTEPIGDGERNSRLASIGGYLRRMLKFDAALIDSTLQSINERRCQPTLPRDEVHAIAQSVAGYKSGEDRDDIPEVEQMGINEVKRMVEILVYSTPDERRASGLNIPVNGKAAMNAASLLVYRHLETRGKFFNSDGVGYLLMNDGKLIMVSQDDAWFSRTMNDYGINPAQEEFAKLGQFITMMTKSDGTKASVHYSSHYNAKTKSFYFAETDSLIKGDGKTLTRVPNGADGELFIFAGQDEPFTVDLDNPPQIKYSLIPDESSLLYKLLFGDLVFKPSSLPPEGKKILLTTYLMLLVLSGLIDEKPLLQVNGSSQTGKTFFLRKFGRAVVGPTFKAMKLSDDVSQLENALINNDVLLFDNVDEVHPKVKSVLCLAVTNFEVVRRELFTTMGQLKVPSKATVMMTALMNVLPTTEQANRSIEIELKRRTNGNIAPQSLLDDFDSERPALVLEIITRAQGVLAAMIVQKDYHPRVENRLAGVAEIILKVARHEGWEPMAKTILTQWNTEQLVGALEDDDVALYIHKWITSKDWQPQTLHAEELDHALRGVRGVYAGEPSWKGARALSVKLNKSQEAYSARFGMEIGDDLSTHSKTFSFKPSLALMVALGGGSPATTPAPVASFALDTRTPTDVAKDAMHAAEVAEETAIAAVEAARPAPVFIKPGDYPLTPMGFNPEDEKWVVNPVHLENVKAIQEAIRQWSKVLKRGGWGAAGLDSAMPKASQGIITFCKNYVGEVDHGTGLDFTPGSWRNLTGDGWNDAFKALQETWDAGAELAVKNAEAGVNTTGKTATAFATYQAGLGSADGSAHVAEYGGAKAVFEAVFAVWSTTF